MPDTKALSVLIVGGGLGGLALAHGLARAGVRATVLERDASPNSRAQGYRISLSEEGTRALNAVLPRDLFERLSTIETQNVGREFTFATSQQSRLLCFRRGNSAGAITVSRPGLRRLLSERVDVRWNKRLVSFRELPDDGGVEARFDDGSVMVADVLVGCDGIGSVVREQMRSVVAGNGGDPSRIPTTKSTGIVSAGATIDRTPELDRALPLNHAGAVYFLGPRGEALFVSFCEDEEKRPMILWALSRTDAAMARPENGWKDMADTYEGRTKLLRDAVERVCGGGWDPRLQRMIRETPVDAIVDPIAITASEVPTGNAGAMWPSGRVTLLGDAAHAMPPHRGIGGNTAFEDAATFAAEVERAVTSGSVDWAGVTSAYEVAMFARGHKAVDESMETAQMVHMNGAVLTGVRNFVLRLADWVGGVKHAVAGLLSKPSAAALPAP